MYTLKSLCGLPLPPFMIGVPDENVKNFFIDICQCFIRKNQNNNNTYFYICGIIDPNSVTDVFGRFDIVTIAHTKEEASWILLILDTLTGKRTFSLLDLLGQYYGRNDDDTVVDPQTCLELSYYYNVKIFDKSKSHETVEILVLSINDMLYYLEKCYPKHIYHIMPDIRQLKEEHEQQIKGLLMTIANLKHKWK